MSDDILSRFRDAGIPREAIGTTLIKEKHPELREYIQSHKYEDMPICTVVADDPLAFYLVAKELSLSGLSVYCCSLVDIHTALLSDLDVDDQIADALFCAKAICIRGFCEKDGRAAPFLTPYESAFIRSWLVRKVADGVKFVLDVEAPLEECLDWWPGSFIRYLRKHGLSFKG